MREFPNATPRPWELVVTPKLNSTGVWVELVTDGGLIIGETYYHGQSEHDDDPEANAALIVHAVNTMEEREMLLEEAAEALCASQEAFEALAKHLPQVDVDVVTGFRIVEANRKARAFLAKLEARDG